MINMNMMPYFLRISLPVFISFMQSFSPIDLNSNKTSLLSSLSFSLLENCFTVSKPLQSATKCLQYSD